MQRADNAVLRLAVGLGLAVVIAYGFGIKPEYLICAGAVHVLCIPGPPTSFLKGAMRAAVIAALCLAGVLMVPLLKMHPVTGILLTAMLLYAAFYGGKGIPNALTTFEVVAIALIPVAGVADQSLTTVFAKGIGLALGVGFLVSAVTHALFPDPPAPRQTAAARPRVSPETARWRALQSTMVLMPVFVISLTDPSFYLSTILKTATIALQAEATNARAAGRELVGSTLVGSLLAAAVWFGLSLRANLWMLMLWVMAAAFWAGARLYRTRPTSESPSFWLNVLITLFMLLGPAIEDSADGKGVHLASAIRVSLFLLVALYAWATVWVVERWRTSRSRLGRLVWEGAHGNTSR